MLRDVRQYDFGMFLTYEDAKNGDGGSGLRPSILLHCLADGACQNCSSHGKTKRIMSPCERYAGWSSSAGNNASIRQMAVPSRFLLSEVIHWRHFVSRSPP